MAAAAPTPHLAALGVMPGPGLVDKLKLLASKDVLNYYNLSITIILELRYSNSDLCNFMFHSILFTSRALVHSTQAKKGVKPPEGSITNAEYCDIIFFIVKKADLQAVPDKKKVKMFLTDKRRYELLDTCLGEGTMLPGDTWKELGSYLGLEQREEQPLTGSVPSADGLLERQALQQLPSHSSLDQELPASLPSQASMVQIQLDFHLAGMVPSELPHLATTELLAGTPDASEVARRVRGGLSLPSVLTNSVVCELLALKVNHKA